MSSIIEGYNYDIFISYRQKDNKHDGWVTEFVNNLKGELESTFKEEIRVYFDINPHDGLLETHDVDESLREKLKCLVFIPIISRTYCDPKAFAWEHEFKAFVELASKDQYGLKIKLPNGNVANRVLPVRIHDLDPEDIKLFEGVTGGVMRTLDFVFKTSTGVNRPLKSKEDHPVDNLNKTYYQDQINKVALAIKEIIQGMKIEPVIMVKKKDHAEESIKKSKEDEKRFEPGEHTRSHRRRWMSAIVIVVFLIIAAIIIYEKISKPYTLGKQKSPGEKVTVAVLPFQNMTNDTAWNIWQDGIQTNIITSLSNSEEIKVRQTETINNLLQSKGITNYTSITPSVASNISQKLDASYFIYGSINQAGVTIRINAQLTNSKTKDIIKSFQVDGTAEKILPTIDSLSMLVNKFLILTSLGKELSPEFQPLASTNSPEAYRYLVYGENAFFKRDYPSAAKFYSQAVAVDSNFIVAIIKLSFVLDFQGMTDQAKKCIMRAYQVRDKISIQQKLFVNYAYARLFETPYEEIKYLKQLLEFDDQMPFLNEGLSYSYYSLFQYDKVIPGYEKALKIYEKWDSKPLWVYSYVQLGMAYHKTGQYNKERKLYKKAEHDFPDDPLLIYRQAILLLTERDTVAANTYIKNYISRSKERSVSDVSIANNMGMMYEESGLMDKAEEYYRRALSLEPGNPLRMNNLSWFLIEKDRNIEEGMKLIDRALELNPESYYMLDTKGWGLYKQRKYKEAMEYLEKSWVLKPRYDHEVYLHLEAAKKAVAGLKNN